MGDWWDMKQRWWQRWTRWRRQGQRRWEGWRVGREARHELRRERMEAEKEGLINMALAKAVLAQSTQELRDALIAEVWAQHEEDLLQQAVARVHEEQREADEARQVAWRAQTAQERRAMEQEAQEAAAAEVAGERVAERRDFETRTDRLIRQRNEAWSRAAEAEGWIVDHLKTLLPDDRPVLLRDTEIPRLRLSSLNAILNRFGFQVEANRTDAMRAVACEVDRARWQQFSRFKLVAVTADVAVVDEADDENAGTLAEAPQDVPVN